MNGKNVKCWASNKIQNKPYETEEVHTLNVHCKYPIVPGSHVTTSCLLSPAQTPPPSPRSRRTCPRTPARRSRWSARRTVTRLLHTRGSGELVNWCIRLRSSTLILFLCQILYLSFHLYIFSIYLNQYYPLQTGLITYITSAPGCAPSITLSSVLAALGPFSVHQDPSATAPTAVRILYTSISGCECPGGEGVDGDVLACPAATCPLVST